MQQIHGYPNPYAVPYIPAGVPPIKRAGRRLAILAGAFVGALALLIGGFFLYKKVTPQHDVLVDNGNDFAVDVEIGAEKFSLGPKTGRTVAVGDGALTVKATGPNGFSETASIEFPETKWSSHGRTAVYNIGGKSPLAIVSVTYGTYLGGPKPIVMISPEPRLALLPAGTYGDIDSSFPEQVSTRRGQSGAIVQRVCRVDVQAKRIGCGGIKRDEN
jgi:hypothetical protein